MLHMGNSQFYHVFPLTPLVLPTPVAALLELLGALNILVLADPVADAEGVIMLLEPLPTPRPRALVVVVLEPLAAASLLRLSSSSAFRAALAFRSCSSNSRFSAASCLIWASSSRSVKS